jgi:ssDNA-binding Zn-finger/Zn-ribbon topoisomerase 1
MIKDYLGDCPVCGGNGIRRFKNDGEHIVCETCHGTEKPVVVEYEEIKGVPEGYAFETLWNWGEKALFVKYHILSKSIRLPYKTGSIDEYICEDCGGKGKKLKEGSRLLWKFEFAYMDCPSCKGKGKINRKVIAIIVVDIKGKPNFKIERVKV